MNNHGKRGFVTYIRCDVTTMCYMVFVSHSLHWQYIKIALQEYVIKVVTTNRIM